MSNEPKIIIKDRSKITDTSKEVAELLNSRMVAGCYFSVIEEFSSLVIYLDKSDAFEVNGVAYLILSEYSNELTKEDLKIIS